MPPKSHQAQNTSKVPQVMLMSAQWWLIIFSIILNPLAFDMFYWSANDITNWIADLYQVSIEDGYIYTNIMNSAYILGVFVSQIIWSIIFSFRHRHIPFLTGISIIICGSICGALFDYWVIQIIARVLIGVGVASELTAAVIIIHDWYAEDVKKLNYSYSIITLVSFLGSLCTPFISVSLIAWFGNWKIIYVVLILYSIIVAIGVHKYIHDNMSEVHSAGQTSISYASTINTIMNLKILKQVIINSLSFSSITLFYTSATYIFLYTYNVSVQNFSILITVNILGAILGSLINAGCKSAQDIKQILYVTIHGSLLLITMAIALYHLQLLTLFKIELCLFMLAVCNGIIAPNTTSGLILANKTHTNIAISIAINNIIRFGMALLISIILIPIISLYQLPGILYITLVIIMLQIITVHIINPR